MLVAASSADADVTWLGTNGPPVVFSAGLAEPAKPGDTLKIVVVAAVRERCGTISEDMVDCETARLEEFRAAQDA
jgi:hypothetical protein